MVDFASHTHQKAALALNGQLLAGRMVAVAVAKKAKDDESEHHAPSPAAPVSLRKTCYNQKCKTPGVTQGLRFKVRGV